MDAVTLFVIVFLLFAFVQAAAPPDDILCAQVPCGPFPPEVAQRDGSDVTARALEKAVCVGHVLIDEPVTACGP